MPRLDDLEHHDDDRLGRLPRRGTHLPRRLPVRIGHRVVPDRGRRAGGRPRAVHLGHVQPHAGQGVERRHRRRRRRPLPPPRGRPRPHGRPRPRGVPLLDRVAPHPADRSRTGQRGRPVVLRAARRRADRPRHPADRDALPLGPAAGPRGRGRVGEPRHRGGLRRLRPHRGGAARRSDLGVDHPQRAVVQRLPRVRVRRARARPPRRRQGPRRGAPPEPRARARDRRAPRGRDERPRLLDHPQPARDPPVGRHGPRGRASHRRAREPGVPRPAARGGVPGRRDRRHGRGHRLVVREAGRHRAHPPAHLAARRQLLLDRHGADVGRRVAPRQRRRPQGHGRHAVAGFRGRGVPRAARAVHRHGLEHRPVGPGGPARRPARGVPDACRSW